MALALWCVLVAAILPAATIGPAKLGGGYDNSDPRNPEFYRTGFRARAHAAHLNGFEAFPLFAVAVLVAQTQGGPQVWVDRLALVFVAARLAYVGCAYAGLATGRTFAWFIAYLAAIAIFVSPTWS